MPRKQIKIIGVAEGEPFNVKTWSGTCYYLFNKFKEMNCLAGAVSCSPTGLLMLSAKLKSFDINIAKWKFKHGINTKFFDIMSKLAMDNIDKIKDYNAILQIGAKFNITPKNSKAIFSYHDGNLHERINSPFVYPKIKKDYISKALQYEKVVYDNVSRIFTFSKWLAKSFHENYDIKMDKIVPVGAGINLGYVPRKYDKSYDSRLILFIGVDFNRKGGSTLLEAFGIVKRELKDCTLRIIGPTLKDLPKNVESLGYVSKNTVDGIDVIRKSFEKASVFVMPSFYEPFGIVFVEAMAHQVPCIGSNICAMPEIIDHGRTGYVVPVGNSKELAKRIIEMLKSDNACKEMGSNAYIKYAKEYTWDIVAEKMKGHMEYVL